MSDYQTSDIRDNAQNRRNAVKPIIDELEKMNSTITFILCTLLALCTAVAYVLFSKKTK